MLALISAQDPSIGRNMELFMLVLRKMLGPQVFVFQLLEKILLVIKEKIPHYFVIGKCLKMLPPNSIIHLPVGPFICAD
jgi:hypothetical protein